MKGYPGSAKQSSFSRPGWGKCWGSYIGPYWITDAIKGTYQLGTLASEVLPKWVNGFQLKPYARPTPPNPFTEAKNNDENVGGEESIEPSLGARTHST